MARTSLTPRPEALPADLSLIATRVEDRLRRLLDDERLRWSALDPQLGDPLEALTDLVLAGGKRLRPAFCHWGFVAAGGDPLDPRVIDAGSAFELLQGFALIHDDVMDGSATRRGGPAVHRRFIESHQNKDWKTESRRFGEGVAILVGDVAFVYADLLLPTGEPEVARLWHELRIELNIGQYLDLAGTATAAFDRDVSRRIARYKSGKYTIQRPLQLGAALAGGHDLIEPIGRYGDPLGEAFQLRDDVLGVFGDQTRTGKPVGDDLREGKPTLLLAIARENASPTGQALLDRIGEPDLSDAEVAELQDLLHQTGAVTGTEAEIERLAALSLEALGTLSIPAAATRALEELAHFVTARDT